MGTILCNVQRISLFLAAISQLNETHGNKTLAGRKCRTEHPSVFLGSSSLLGCSNMYRSFLKPSHKPLVQWKQPPLSTQTRNSPTEATLFIVTAHLQLQIDLIGVRNEEKPAAAWKVGKTYSANEKPLWWLWNSAAAVCL